MPLRATSATRALALSRARAAAAPIPREGPILRRAALQRKAVPPTRLCAGSDPDQRRGAISSEAEDAQISHRACGRAVSVGQRAGPGTRRPGLAVLHPWMDVGDPTLDGCQSYQPLTREAVLTRARRGFP